MSELTFELDADETSVLELKFGQYIKGDKGDTGQKGDTGADGSLKPADIAYIDAATNSAQASAQAAAGSANAAANSATSAAASATQAKNDGQAAAAQAQASANAAKTSETNAAGSATQASASRDAAASSAAAAAASSTSAGAWNALAQDWAVKMNGLVSGTDYSSKYYAGQSGASAGAAAGSASAAAASAAAADASKTAAAGSAAAAAGSAADAANSAASVNPQNLVPIDGSRAMTAPLQTTGLALQGSARRITADYSATSQAARALFQSSVANGATSVGAIPNGTGPGANFIGYALTDASNSPYVQMGCSPTLATLNVYATGTGAPPPFNLNVGGALRYAIDTAGNHSFSGSSAAFAHNTVYFNGPTQAILAFQKAGVLRYGFGWDGGNFVCNRYNASGAYASTPFYVRDSDGALICGPMTATSITMAGTLTNTGNAIELGPTAAGPAYIDFHSSGNATDYDARVIATGGTAAAGNGTLELYAGGINLKVAAAFVNLYGSSTYANLRLIAGAYQPFMRASAGNSSIEWVNSANSAVNMGLTDAGLLSVRGSTTTAGIYNNGGLQQSGQLWMTGANSIRLDGGSYSGYLRGDSSGLVGFINQAQNNWTMQIKDSGYVWCSNGWTWGDASNVGGQYAGTGSTGGHTERNAIVQQSDNVNMYLGHTGAGGTMIWFGVVGANVGSISCSTSATSYNTASDYRLKTNIEDLTGGLDRVMQMRPVAFDWKASGEPSRGFIAHELEPIEPDAVTGVKDAMMQDRGDPDGPEVPAYQQVDLSFLIPDMVAAMQDLKSQLDAALARIATLEGATP